VNLLVARTGQHSLRELEATLARYRQNGIKPDGFVFTTCGQDAAAMAITTAITMPTRMPSAE